jgi:hypothetical protein
MKNNTAIYAVIERIKNKLKDVIITEKKLDEIIDIELENIDALLKIDVIKELLQYYKDELFFPNKIYNELSEIELEKKIKQFEKIIECLGNRLEKLKTQMTEFNSNQKNGNKNLQLDLTERMLIIAYLQKHKLFPKHNTQIGQTQSIIENFISALLNENIDSIVKARKKASDFFNNKNITTAQKPFKLRNLNNIKHYFENLGHKEVLSEIEELIEKINKN